MDYKKFYGDILTHVVMMVTTEMRIHACADPTHHDLSFQIFRLLNGYDKALEELNNVRTTIAKIGVPYPDGQLCFCQKAIGNPLSHTHTPACIELRRFNGAMVERLKTQVC